MSSLFAGFRFRQFATHLGQLAQAEEELPSSPAGLDSGRAAYTALAAARSRASPWVSAVPASIAGA
jgi:SOS response associated peptidase (SRAP)